MELQLVYILTWGIRGKELEGMGLGGLGVYCVGVDGKAEGGKRVLTYVLWGIKVRLSL